MITIQQRLLTLQDQNHDGLCYVKLGYVTTTGYDPKTLLGNCLMVPNQSASTLIDLTSGRDFPHSCKYSTGEALKVWFARGAIAIASEGNAPNYQFAQWC